MNIYVITRTDDIRYGTYDSAIVVANNAKEAARIHPNPEEFASKYDTWVTSSDFVKVEQIGVADEKYKSPQVILASFIAG